VGVSGCQRAGVVVVKGWVSPGATGGKERGRERVGKGGGRGGRGGKRRRNAMPRHAPSRRISSNGQPLKGTGGRSAVGGRFFVVDHLPKAKGKVVVGSSRW
jgi:hypothetical protein